MGYILECILGVIVAVVIGIFAYAREEHIKRNIALAECKKDLYEKTPS